MQRTYNKLSRHIHKQEHSKIAWQHAQSLLATQSRCAVNNPLNPCGAFSCTLTHNRRHLAADSQPVSRPTVNKYPTLTPPSCLNHSGLVSNAGSHSLLLL